MKDQTCVGYRSGNTTCTAGEFTVSPVFSAAPGTPPFCVAGEAFNFQVELGLSGSNTDRMDVGFFVGQQGNDPRAETPGNNCSVATFPTSPLPWKNVDFDACGDFLGGGNQTTTINEIKVVCAGDTATGELTIPYVLTYWQNNGNACTGPADVQNGSPSKCNAGTSAVSGVVAVRVGAYVDVTKATLPAGNTSQSFTYTATGPAGSKVVALVGATYTPTLISAATNTATVSITGGQTVRFYIDATASNKSLTITEAAAPGWESAAQAISCSSVKGNPSLTTNPATRTITANNLTVTNSAAACTFTNKQSSRITLVKTVGGRVDNADQFSVGATGGGTLVGTASATTSGTATTASTTFYSSPSATLNLMDAKAAGPTALTGYDTRLTCTNAFTGAGATPNASLPNNLNTTSANITPAPGDDITCTYTNTPKPRISLQKVIGASGNGRVADTDQFTLAMTGAASVTTTGSGASITSPPAALIATPGTAVTLTETAAGTTNLSNYTTTYACTNTSAGGTAIASGIGTSFSFTPANKDVIACTFTNTRKAAHFTLQKTWVNATVNDAAIVSATGLTSLNSVANAANETDTAAAQSVHAGDIITLAETFGPDNAARYTGALSCTGTAGLSGNTVIIGPTDTDVICTYTNAKIEAVIAGSVFKDSGTGGGTANNAIQDGTEAGISGVTVRLTDCNGITYGTAATDGAGSYRFLASGVPEGSVCVEESNLSAYTSTGINVAGSTTPPGYTLVTADKIGFSLANGISHAGLNFGDVPANQFLTDGNQTGIAGSTLIYPHTFIAGTGGSVTFSLPGAVASPNIPGWSEVLYMDGDCDALLDDAEANSLLLPVALTVAEGQTLCLIQKEFIPAGADQGASNYVPVQALFAYVGSSLPDAVYTRQDVTTVGSSALLLYKEVRNVSTPTTPAWKTRNTAKPGEILEYRITYTNNGPDPITNLQINDATPAFTTFVSGLCEIAAPATPASLGLCTLTLMPPPQRAGALKWTFSSTGSPSQLPPAGTGFVTFQVKVD
ncbi:SdrD B-like domain-containing protein [Methylomicrobium lacus]|uniref:SdrD B-like domain-containing protein n=1 Tax=Methylomicrobium lacus TaxID=136992 RepID=UPI0035A95ABE